MCNFLNKEVLKNEQPHFLRESCLRKRAFCALNFNCCNEESLRELSQCAISEERDPCVLPSCNETSDTFMHTMFTHPSKAPIDGPNNGQKYGPSVFTVTITMANSHSHNGQKYGPSVFTVTISHSHNGQQSQSQWPKIWPISLPSVYLTHHLASFLQDNCMYEETICWMMPGSKYHTSLCHIKLGKNSIQKYTGPDWKDVFASFPHGVKILCCLNLSKK